MTFKTFLAQPKYPSSLQPLFDLAGNLWTLWNYDALALFYRIDAQLFRNANHNPIKFLYSLSKERLDELSHDEGFLFELRNVWDRFKKYIQHPGTYKKGCDLECQLEKGRTVAYFSMEYALHESIPIYAGGLGVLAGDFLKCASDLNLPVIGVGLLYKYGYFTQYVDSKGFQSEVYVPFEEHLLPLREVRDSKGRLSYINVRILREDVRVKLWEIAVGNTRLILLDTDIEENPPYLRDITNELYTSSREKRIQQEIILGVGGVRALEVLGIKPTLFHLNEGHAAFVIIGRLKTLLSDEKLSLAEAKAIIRASTIFTTHTPVMAGNENFLSDLVERHLEPLLGEFGLSFKDIETLGYINGELDKFWQPAFSIHFAKYINGVSKQHTEVSKKIWLDLFPGQPTLEIPITHITNGVHLSWISPSFINLLNNYVGPDYVRCGDRADVWRKIYDIPDDELWEEHRRNKKEMINFIRRHIARQMSAKGYSRFVSRLLNPEYLTIVFARRFAGYKRPTLILNDKERLKNILTDSAEPVQIIFAGKAHPADETSKKMIKEVIDFAKNYHLEDRVIFLENYDMNVARHLYWGADVWLNTPAQNMEASGTSGMKAAMNGALHLSTFEGWWQEGYNGTNGWAVTAGMLYDKSDLQDVADANQFYDFLEHEITALYYERNEADVPEGWVGMMKESLVSVCRYFNMNRVLCEYFTKFYVPASDYLKHITDDGYKLLKEAVREEKDVIKHFGKIKIISFTTDADAKERLTKGEQVEAGCSVDFQDAPDALFSVELFYMIDGGSRFKVIPMSADGGLPGQKSVILYRCVLEVDGFGIQSINVRVRPANEIVRDLHPELVKWKE
jgi:starch phosphorylase